MIEKRPLPVKDRDEYHNYRSGRQQKTFYVTERNEVFWLNPIGILSPLHCIIRTEYPRSSRTSKSQQLPRGITRRKSCWQPPTTKRKSVWGKNRQVSWVPLATSAIQSISKNTLTTTHWCSITVVASTPQRTKTKPLRPSIQAFQEGLGSQDND